MKTKWWIGLVAAVLIAGCVPSIHPWFKDEDVVFEEKLLGVWEQENENNIWVFEKGDGEKKEYRLTILSKEKIPSVFQATLFKLDGKFYLDSFPGSESLRNTNEFFQTNIIGVHQLYRLDSIEPTMQFRILNPDTIGKMLKEKPDLIAHESPRDDEAVLLTAATEKLQKFISDHADEEKFLSETNTLKRRTPLFTEKDFGFESKLVGRWIDADGTICIIEGVNNQSYRAIAIRSNAEKTEITNYGAAVVTINSRRFVAVYEGIQAVKVSSGTDADRTPDLLLWIEQMDPVPQYRVIEYAQAAEILKMNDEQFKSAVEKLYKVRWIPLVPAEKR